jgi:hypothetical protein
MFPGFSGVAIFESGVFWPVKDGSEVPKRYPSESVVGCSTWLPGEVGGFGP